jgi:hypothetical protein
VTAFEFFTVLLSFVVSLGVATLLAAVVRLIQESPRVHFSFTWALWAAAVFNLQIIFWLRSWTYHDNYALMTATSLPPLILAIIAFIACGLATPQIPDTGPIDLRGFHAKQGRKYQIGYAAFMLVAIIQGALMNRMIDDNRYGSLLADTIVLLILAAISIAAAIFRRQRWLQIGAPILFLVSALAFYGRLME